MLGLIIGCIKHLDLSAYNGEQTRKFGLAEQPKLRKYFLDYMLNYLLLPYDLNKKPSAPAPQANGQQPPTDAITTATSNPASEVPACLNEKVFKQFKADLSTESEDEIEEVFCLYLI